jgi:cytosine/adenosine deaminase-related metal-dependent hydrolase
LWFILVPWSGRQGLWSWQQDRISYAWKADIILLRKEHINVLPVDDPVAAITLGMDSSNVDTVFVAGAVKKRNGQLAGVDLKRIGELANRSRDYLAAKARE